MIIYKITNKINGKIYIGQTANSLSTRWSQHIHYALKKIGKSIFSLAIRKYGKENFSPDILKNCESIEEMNELERYYIESLNTLAPNGYNLDGGGKNKIMHQSTKNKLSIAQTGKKRGPQTDVHRKNLSLAHKGRTYLDRIVSNETRNKISEANSGPNNHMSGKKQTEYNKQKVSEANLNNIYWVGRKHKEESKLKMSKSRLGKYSGENNPMYGRKGILSPNFGKNCSDDTRKKISLGHNRFKVRIVCLNDGIIYDSIKSAARILGISPAGIRKVITGKTYSVRGFIFKRLENK